MLDLNIFLWIATSVADANAVNPNGIKTRLANGLSTFPIKGNPVSSNGPKSPPKNSPDCLILSFYISWRTTYKSFMKLWKLCIS